MIRKNLYFYEEQVRFLEKLKGKFSDHVRRAVDRYIDRLKSNRTSASRSKKEGDSDE